MSWSLKAHVLDHSAAVHNTLGSKREFDENNPKNHHFTFSCDIASLIVHHGCKCQKDIDEKMKAFMDDLVRYEKKHPEVKEIHKKTGEKIYRNIKFDFSDALLAYHNSASDSSNSNNYSVNPHFHALFHHSQRLKVRYGYLREAIDEVSKLHGLIFNFQEETGKPKVDSKKATDFSWFVKRSSDNLFKRRVKDGWVKQALSDFQDHYKQTGNLQYLLKAYKDLEMRCKRLKVPHDLEFGLFLSEEQKSTIKTLYSGDKEKILELVKDRSNHIARAYVEHVHGFSNIIIDEVQKGAGERMPIVELDLNSINQKIERKVKVDRLGNFMKTLAHAYQKDLQTALEHSRDEKQLEEMMIKLGYVDFAFRAKKNSGKRERVGFTYKRDNKLTTVYFNNLKMSMNDIRAVLLANSKNADLPMATDFTSHLMAYQPPKRVSYANTRFEQIYDLKSSLDLKGFFVREVDSKAVEFKAKKTFIVDNGNKISVKTQRIEDLERNVQIIADMVEAKGIQRYNITGSEPFKIAMLSELNRREQQRAGKVDEIKDESTPTEQSDDDVLKELSDMHLSKHSIDNRPDEYRQLFKIRSNALAERNINKLLKSYDVLPTIDHHETREKLIAMAKCQNISFKVISDEIALENGFSRDELDVFRNTVRQMDNFDSIYLDKFIVKLKDALNEALLLDESLSDNHLERNIRLMENLSSELDDFQAAHLSKKDYIRRIEDIEEALASDNFHEVQTLMDGLEEDDKQVVEYRLSEKIDLAAAKLDFDQLKRGLERDMHNIALPDNELLVNHKPTQELL